jgi:hypothetical protein
MDDYFSKPLVLTQLCDRLTYRVKRPNAA